MLFSDLQLREELLLAIKEKGYQQPTPIQEQAIPIILSGSDLLGGAQTGTGKTAGFTLPLLHKLMQNHSKSAKGRKVRGLILAPTRELAAQIAESVTGYAKHLPLKTLAVFGGVNISPQIKKLRSGVDILIATPGRLLDLYSQRAVDLTAVEIFVLDEADRMMDMGFINDIKEIISLVPKKKQSLLFSATFPKEIKSLAESLLKSPQTIEVAPNNTAAESVTQIIHPVDTKRKQELLCHLIVSEKWKQVLVFTRTKHSANKLTSKLIDSGISADAIHGNKSQSARSKALADFKKGSLQVLVATDIVARGLDIQSLPYVVNFELPQAPEDYIHRIGRTGRAGKEGTAYSLVSIDEKFMLQDIERLLKQKIPSVTISGFEPDPSIAPEPIQRGVHPARNKAFKARREAKQFGKPKSIKGPSSFKSSPKKAKLPFGKTR